MPDYADGVASALTNLGDVVRSLGRSVEAKAACDLAIAVRERLVQQNPTTPIYRANLAASLRRRGLACRDLGDVAGAAGDVRRAVSLYDGLARRSREEWYETACCHAALAALAASPSEAASEADVAIALLKKAVALGYRNQSAFQTESSFDALRNRPDFRLLMMDASIPSDAFATPPSSP